MIEELDKESLQDKFSKALLLKTSNVAQATIALENLGISSYQVINQKEIRIQTDITIAEINKSLVTSDVPVDMLTQSDYNLESYYTELIRKIEEN